MVCHILMHAGVSLTDKPSLASLLRENIAFMVYLMHMLLPQSSCAAL